MSGYTEIDMHLSEFEGLEVVNYDPEVGLADPSSACPRLYAMYYDRPTERVKLSGPRKVAMVAVVLLTALGMALWSGWAVLFGIFALSVLLPGRTPPELVDLGMMWERFEDEPRLAEVQALVVGPWFDNSEYDGHADMLAHLIRVAPKMPALRAIFLGDIVSEECEISWIEQGDVSPLLDAYPNLETLAVRGGTSLRFNEAAHARLRKLTVQSGGLSTRTIADIATAELPSLTHLDLWFGDRTYGFDATIDDIQPLWAADRFPNLSTLALRNCFLADEIAMGLARQQDAVSRLNRLDLSLGTLTDIGAEALFNNPGVAHLDSLDLHHHYLSDDWVEKLQTLGVDVNTQDPQGAQEPAEDYIDDQRYVAVGE